MFMVELVTIAKTGKQPRSPWVGGGREKTQRMRTVGRYSAVRRNPATNDAGWALRALLNRG